MPATTPPTAPRATQPALLLTRRFPEAVEARARRDYRCVLREADAPLTGPELLRKAEGVDAILCAAGDPLDAATVEALPDRVRMLATFSVGTDHIDLAVCARRGILVSNTPDVLSVATAEIAMTLILMCARRAGEAERMLRAGEWRGWAPTQLRGVTLENKVLGILGMGRIGQALSRMAAGFGMQVHYLNRRRLPPTSEAGAVFHEDEKAFLKTVDVLSMHIPGGEATHHWLNAERIGQLRPGSIVVNTGRGTTVDDAALCAALHAGHLRAAGLDVFAGEPGIFPGYLEAPNAVLLPHLGSATEEARDAMGFRCLDNLDAVLLRGEAPLHPVG